MSCGVAEREWAGLKRTAYKQTAAAVVEHDLGFSPPNLLPCQDGNYVKDLSAECVRVVYVRQRIPYRFFRHGDWSRESLQLATAHGKFMALKSLSGLPDGPHKCSVVTLQLRGIHQEIFFSSLPACDQSRVRKFSKCSPDNSKVFLAEVLFTV